MTRALALVGLFLLLVLGVAGLVGWLAYGTAPPRSGKAALPGLAAEARLVWPGAGDSAAVYIEAATEADFYAALGYAHATDRAWSMALWRQAALGTLSAWLGAEQTQRDEHARLVGFAEQGRIAYERLPESRRRLLEAYARGANAALARPGVAERDEFVSLDVRPEPWQAWHSLAVERLVAYLGTPPARTDSAFAAAARADAPVARFVRADSAFRTVLGLHGFRQARAYAARDRAGEATFVHHQPYGTTARALFYEVTLRLGDEAPVSVATIPGTLALPAGLGPAHAWGVFLTSDLSLEPYEGTPPPPVFSRLVDRAGNETLLEIPRGPDGLLLAASAPPEPRAAPSTRALPAALPSPGSEPAPQTAPTPAQGPSARDAGAPRAPGAAAQDTLAADSPPRQRYWRVVWAGFGSEADLDAWRALRAGQMPPAFAVLRGDGLRMTPAGEATVLGVPPTRAAGTGWALAGADAEARFAAAGLAALVDAGSPAAQLVDESFSAWAARLLPSLLVALGPRDALPYPARDAYAYLAGWDFRYTREAIAPALFEAWMTSHRALTGALPDPSDPRDRGLLVYTLRMARATLRDRYGREPTAWRWEYVQEAALTYPLVGSPRGRFAPLAGGPGGHPTALRPGPARFSADSTALAEPAPGLWSAHARSGSWHLRVRRPDLPSGGFLARDRAEARRHAWLPVTPPPSNARLLRLVPA
ncbi:MAG: penicillin acylase family protein [Rubricoccaceae bacterium]